MAVKKKKTAENSLSPVETWRKPLQVPPRTNSMRSFYQGAEESPSPDIEQDNQTALIEKNVRQSESDILGNARTSTRKTEVKKIETNHEAAAPLPEILDNADISEKITAATNTLTPNLLTQKLGIAIDDLFDIHELLRGKSYDIYQTLIAEADENGRCKITQPELMIRTGIKNRRTFYKHEDWLIGLHLIEKRHLPGDHKGVVYRIFQMAEVLPITGEMLKKLQAGLKIAE